MEFLKIVSYRQSRHFEKATSTSFLLICCYYITFLLVFISRTVAEDGLDLGGYQY
jgi:hypothetical protein